MRSADSHRRAAKQSGDAYNKEITRGMRQAEGEAKRSSSRIAGFFKSQLGQLTAFFGLWQMLRFGRDVIKMGMDSAEVANKFSVTFGAAEKSVQDFVDSWAAIAGLNKNEAKDFLATTGSIIQGLGGSQDAAAALSVQVAKMAGDLTSFSNVPIAQTSQAITRALTGEYEALKTLGIAVNQEMIQQKAMTMTRKESKEELTKLELAMAAAALVQSQMTVQTGDLENTQDSLANTARRAGAEWDNLKIAIGETITGTSEVPALLGSITNALSAGVDWLKAHKTEVQSWAGNIISFTAWVARGLGVTVGNITKLFFNGGQVIGNMLELSFNGFKLWIQDIMNDAVMALNWFIDQSNKYLKTDFERIDLFASGKTRGRIEQLKNDVTKNLMDMGDAVKGVVTAFDEMGISADRARRKATTGISSAAATGGAGVDTPTAKELAKAAKEAEKAAKERARAEEQEIGTLLKAYELRMLSRQELERMMELERQWRAKSLDTNLSLEDRVRARELADQAGKPRQDIAAAATTGILMGLMGPGGEQETEAQREKRERELEELQEYYDTIADYAGQAAGIIEDHFARAFENMGADFDAVATLAGAAFTAIGEMATESIRQWAGRKVKENMAAALQAAAYALGFSAVGNFASSGAAWASAAQHTAAALAWGALAGGASAAGRALSGGSRGGSGGGGDALDRARNQREQEKIGPDIHVHIRPWDRNNPVVQEEIGEAARLYQERYGGNVKVVNDG